MKTRHPDLPPLTTTEWSTVAAALALDEDARVPLFAAVTRMMRTALTGKAPAAAPVDPRTAAIRAFMHDTRRFRRPADTIAPALIAHGFTPHQVAALAALSIH